VTGVQTCALPICTQWQDGKQECVWPFGWEGVTYEGSNPYKLPPWVVEHWKKK
jgi:branched-chain amino acid transport system substrate-binding protein